MRIRQIKPGWWLDKELRRSLPAAAREYYIGLWMLADDAGWIDWDPERIAAELYPYGVDVVGTLFAGDPIAAREEAVETWTAQLVALSPSDPHLVILDCGHAQLPKLTAHQRFGGRPVYTVREAHARGCARMRADARPGSARGNGIGTVGKGNGTVVTTGETPATTEPTEPTGLKARLGDFSALLREGAKP